MEGDTEGLTKRNAERYTEEQTERHSEGYMERRIEEYTERHKSDFNIQVKLSQRIIGIETTGGLFRPHISPRGLGQPYQEINSCQYVFPTCSSVCVYVFLRVYVLYNMFFRVPFCVFGRDSLCIPRCVHP